MNILTAVWAWLTSGVGLWGSSGVGVLVLAYMMKKYVGKKLWDSIGIGIENLFFVLFSIVTIFMNKLTKGLWNKTIEPAIKILLQIIFESALKGSLRGLDSDDKLPNE